MLFHILHYLFQHSFSDVKSSGPVPSALLALPGTLSTTTLDETTEQISNCVRQVNLVSRQSCQTQWKETDRRQGKNRRKGKTTSWMTPQTNRMNFFLSVWEQFWILHKIHPTKAPQPKKQRTLCTTRLRH